MKLLPIVLLIALLALVGTSLYKNGQITLPRTTNNLIETAEEPTSIPSASPNAKKSTASPKSTSSPFLTSTTSVKLNSVSPTSANSGEEVRLLGSGFGTITGKVLIFNQILGPNNPFMYVTPNRWTDSEIKITIPPAVGGQVVDIEVSHKDGTKSNRIKFTIKGGQPRIDSFSPSNAQPLQQISIYGKEFGDSQGKVNIYKLDNNDVSNPNANCQINSWSGVWINCTLPSTVNNGTEYGFAVETSDGRRSPFQYYKVGN